MNELDKRARRRLLVTKLAKRHMMFCQKLARLHCHFVGLTAREVAEMLKNGARVDESMWLAEDVL